MGLIEKYKRLIIYGLLFLVMTTLYSQAVGFEYIWDDYLLIEDNYAIKSGEISYIFQPILADTTYFRPLVMLSFILDNQISHNPWFGHVVNLIFFLLNAYLVFNISKTIFEKTNLSYIYIRSFLASLFYIVHPIIVETTVWLSGRFDIFVTFFTLISIYLFLSHHISTKNKNIIIPILFLCGLLSKELAIVLPVLLFILYFLLESRQNFFKALIEYLIKFKVLNISIILVFIIYFCFRIYFMGEAYHTGAEVYDPIKSVQFWWILLPIDTFYFYIERIILPFQQMSPVHFGSKDSLLENKIYFKAFIFLTFISYIIWGIVKKKVAAIMLLMAFVSLFLVLNFIPITIGASIGHDRFLTLPLSFICITLFSISPTIKLKNIYQYSILGVSFLYFFILASVSYSYAAKWKTDVELWRYTNFIYKGSIETSVRYVRALTLYNKVDELNKYFETRISLSNQWNFVDAINLSDYLILKGDNSVFNILDSIYYDALNVKKHSVYSNSATDRSLFEVSINLARAHFKFSKDYQQVFFYLKEAEKYNKNSLTLKFLKAAVIYQQSPPYHLEQLNYVSSILSDSTRIRLIEANQEMFAGLCLQDGIFKSCK